MFEFSRGDTFALQVVGRENNVSLSANLKKVKEGGKTPEATDPIIATFVVEDSTFNGQDSWLIKLLPAQTANFIPANYAMQLKREKTDFTTHSKIVFVKVKESLF